MHLLVTGACGYVGSALVPMCQDEPAIQEVTVLDSLSSGSPRNLLGSIGSWLNFRQGDVREYGDVEAAMRHADAVIHLAAITGAAATHDHPERTRAVNRDGTENVLLAADKFGVNRVVLASSCNVFGRATSTDIDEETRPDPINPYAESKLEAEALLREADVDGAALRMSTVYGGALGMRFNLVVNDFVFRALTNRPLTVYGDGSNWRPFIHVEDAAGAFLDAVLSPERWSGEIYNVGANSENYQIKDIARIVRDVLGEDVEVTYLEDEHPGPSYHVNFDKVAEVEFDLEWDLAAGVGELAERFRGRAEGRYPEAYP